MTTGVSLSLLRYGISFYISMCSPVFQAKNGEKHVYVYNSLGLCTLQNIIVILLKTPTFFVTVLNKLFSIMSLFLAGLV